MNSAGEKEPEEIYTARFRQDSTSGRRPRRHTGPLFKFTITKGRAQEKESTSPGQQHLPGSKDGGQCLVAHCSSGHLAAQADPLPH
ncbi:MAG: hypothetical protein LUF81_04190, partial [Clostridiales bacterium]|nr:hypothetical protein [Clostridiales bacterium]